ncbi:MAG: alpha/beta hydrolase [Alistipes sp.]|nr:alpha/beta hydrolase [Alistipes sp.]
MGKSITYQGTRLHYTRSGAGHPLFLLHGWGCSTEIWQRVLPFLEERFMVINVDFAGFGQSEEPSAVWGVEEYTRSVEAIAQAEGIENPILVGHSFGGRVSIVYASRNKTQKIILVDAAGVKPRRSFTYYRKVYTFKLMKWLAPILMGKERAQQMIEKRRAKAGSSDYNNASPRMRAILSKCVNEDLCHLMPKIQAPTLLFWGENDTATPLADAKRMEKLIPDAGLVTVAGAGHYSFLENTPLFMRVVESFLSKEIRRNGD